MKELNTAFILGLFGLMLLGVFSVDIGGVHLRTNLASFILAILLFLSGFMFGKQINK